MFKLDEVLNQKAKTLSGGWQRKVSVAISLINNPKILFLDEPTLGLDVIARKELWAVIENLKGKITIILTTHYMEEAESLSDRIGIMAKGNLIAVGTSNELIEQSDSENFEDAFVKIATGGKFNMRTLNFAKRNFKEIARDPLSLILPLYYHCFCYLYFSNLIYQMKVTI